MAIARQPASRPAAQLILIRDIAFIMYAIYMSNSRDVDVMYAIYMLSH